MIKQHYNTNDRLKFILSFIKWSYGLNDRSKHVKNEEKITESKRDEDEIIQSKNGPLRVNRMNSKVWNRKLIGRRSTNDEEQTKNSEERWRTLAELITETSRKRYGSVLAWIFSFFLLFLTNFKWILSAKDAEPFFLSPSRHFIAKTREVVATQLAQTS